MATFMLWEWFYLTFEPYLGVALDTVLLLEKLLESSLRPVSAVRTHSAVLSHAVPYLTRLSSLLPKSTLINGRRHGRTNGI